MGAGDGDDGDHDYGDDGDDDVGDYEDDGDDDVAFLCWAHYTGGGWASE